MGLAPKVEKAFYDLGRGGITSKVDRSNVIFWTREMWIMRRDAIFVGRKKKGIKKYGREVFPV